MQYAPTCGNGIHGRRIRSLCPDQGQRVSEILYLRVYTERSASHYALSSSGLTFVESMLLCLKSETCVWGGEDSTSGVFREHCVKVPMF
jgi:hypothetical protein